MAPHEEKWSAGKTNLQVKMCCSTTTVAQSEFIYPALCGQACDIDWVID